MHNQLSENMGGTIGGAVGSAFGCILSINIQATTEAVYQQTFKVVTQMRLLIIIGIFFAAVSCSREVTKNISKGDVKRDEQSIKTDSTKEETLVTNEKAVHYGDTLKASLSFNKEIHTDVIESGGIKVKGTLIDMGNGQYKVDINAIAKPISSTEKTTASKSYQAGLTQSRTLSKDSTYTIRDVHKKSKVSSTGFMIWGFIIFIIICVIVYVYKKFGFGWLKIF